MLPFSIAELPFCHMILPHEWRKPGRYFAGFNLAGELPALGVAVVEEFGTFSSPIFVAHPDQAGKIYNFGITLAHARDPELPIDMGWPPVCLSSRTIDPKLPANWESMLRQAIEKPAQTGADDRQSYEEYAIFRHIAGDVHIVGVDAPLLPRQLKRLCSSVRNAFAFSTAFKVTPQDKAAPLRVPVIGESHVEKIARLMDRW